MSSFFVTQQTILFFDLCGSNLLIKVIVNLLFAQTTYIFKLNGKLSQVCHSSDFLYF